MSITSEEVNYLIWRYLQECGKEVSALALQEETRVLDFDKQFGSHIPIGALVDFLQKGILYTESELLVRHDRAKSSVDAEHVSTRDFNLLQALEISKDRVPPIRGEHRFELAGDDHASSTRTEIVGKLEGTESLASESSNFIKTLRESSKISKSAVSRWNPSNSLVLAHGGPSLVATIVTFEMPEPGTLSKVHEIKCENVLVSQREGANSVTCLEWSPAGHSLAVGTESGKVRLWTVDGKLQNVFEFHNSCITTIKWNQDSLHFLTCDVDNVAIIWNSLTGTALQQFSPREAGSADTLGIDASWVGVDKFVIPGGQGNILLCEMGESRPLGKLSGHTKALTAFDYNPETKLLVSASDDKTLRVWRGGNLNSSNCFMGNSQSVTSAAWLDNDKVISTSMDGSVQIWSQASSSLLALSMVDGVPIFCGALSPDKQKFAVGKMDGEINLYDVSKLHAVVKEAVNPVNVHPIPLYGDYQSNSEGNCITDLAWDPTSTYLAICYSESDATVIYVG
ncbi:LAME_0F03356g1_1 [Lachancea meyersii CBS 8951]|uniref:LAME_0F03356g1_1 n=1 Tax=Lachancea meyersii CBS 8951 TaxID=1266667 RepID=A0A1G4JR85_9SACH|nr:LAME_0F03356g1_1 [Lachancea meyersii CBS 8951]